MNSQTLKKIAKQFDINSFNNESLCKFYFLRGRHTDTSLRLYKDNLYVHKLLGNNYEGVTKREYLSLIELMNTVYKFLRDRAKFGVVDTEYIGYNNSFNCIERVDKYGGDSLIDSFSLLDSQEKLSVVYKLLDNLTQLFEANPDDSLGRLEISIDPTPGNFTYKNGVIKYIDFMPPLVRNAKINPHFVSDKLRTPVEIVNQNDRYLTQFGVYITFLTKFGAADVTYFDQLFKLTVESIKNLHVKSFVCGNHIQRIRDLCESSSEYFDLKCEIDRLITNDFSNRDLLRYYSLIFIKDFNKIKMNACRYRPKGMSEFLAGKRCLSDIISTLIYSDLRGGDKFMEFKSLVINLIALNHSD